MTDFSFRNNIISIPIKKFRKLLDTSFKISLGIMLKDGAQKKKKDGAHIIEITDKTMHIS